MTVYKEDIIFRSKFIYKFSFTVRRVKVSSFPGLKLSEIISRYHLLDIQKTWIKNFKCVSTNGIFM